ncbi:MAG: universal stress protein [Acidobacteriota bacterium]|nr:universal stress protein [Acidobacteriota bacterium]MDH3784765.1 universal stress protein [Acidobacteriota bacterium]
MSQINKILIPTDLSDVSQKGLEFGAMMARQFDAAVILGYVVQDTMPPIMGTLPGDYPALMERHSAIARETLEKTANTLRADGIAVELDVRPGIPSVEIREMAESHGVDLIVISSHGRGFISRAILGSTTERLVRQAKCPVLVVTDPRHE